MDYRVPGQSPPLQRLAQARGAASDRGGRGPVARHDALAQERPAGRQVEELGWYGRPGATLANEQVAALFETDAGHRVLCVQVAGYVARRIVCWLTEGERVARGERYGLIRFGARMDLYVPKEAEMRVKPGDKVTGGASLIGVLP